MAGRRFPTDFSSVTPADGDKVLIYDASGGVLGWADVDDLNNASFLSVADAGNRYTATTVEGVLDEIGAEVDALVISGGGISIASQGEVVAATDNTKAVTPKQFGDFLRTAVKTGADGGWPINWEHEGSAGYLLHLFTGTGFTGGAVVGIGVGDGDGAGNFNEGGVGLLVNNKKSGVGVMILNNATVDDATAYGLAGQQSGTVAPLVYLTQNVAGAAPALTVIESTGTATAGQILVEYTSTTSGPATFGYRLGAVYADSGMFEWYKDVVVNGGSVVVAEVDGGRTLASSGQVHLATGSNEGRLDLYRWSGAANLFYPWSWRSTVTGVKLVTGTAADVGAVTFNLTVIEADYSGGSTKLGFFAATPAAKPTGVAVTAAGIHAALVTLGLIAA